MAGKKKMGCLDMSTFDRYKFVSEKGIKEELQTQNREKDG
jgi:hypothetical protein